MQRKKIVIAAISLLLVGLALPGANINKAHAFLNTHSLSLGNVLISPNLPSGVGGEAVQGGTSLTVTANVQGSLFTPSYQRNITIGFKADWMQNYQNASMFTLTSGQIGSTSFSVSVPSTAGILPLQHWNVEVWDGPSGSSTIANCDPSNSENNPTSGIKTSCISLGSGFVTILTSDQYAAAQARNNAEIITGSIGTLSNSAANAQLDQANAELTLGDQAWQGSDYAGAKTHYQNAQNDANGALATAYNLNGGSQNAGIVSIIESGTGILLFGVGGLLAGFGGLLYLRRKPKA